MTDRTTRRQFLAGAAVATGVALAGCGGQPSSGPTVSSDADTLPAPTLGPEDADVTVMAFEDYACGHCQTYSLDIFPQVRSEYIEPGSIRYEFHDFPLPVSEQSRPAANAARAVQDTVDTDAFWSFSKGLFENQSRLGPELYAQLAETVGADPETVRTAATEATYDVTVQADVNRGSELGIRGTPGVVVDGQLVEDYRFDNLSSVIDDAL